MKKSFFALLGAVALWCFGACASRPPAEETVVPVLPAPAPEEPEPEPRILEPVLSISSIAILQAELINTRLRVRLRIDNPNNFSLELSAFNYELHGAGRYWAEGREADPLEIPPEGYAEKDLFLLMNFMNMKREVLDQVIALKTVECRFFGNAVVGAADERLPRFVMGFDISGESPVEQ
jgi:LEA14-like dessication related protein